MLTRQGIYFKIPRDVRSMGSKRSSVYSSTTQITFNEKLHNIDPSDQKIIDNLSFFKNNESIPKRSPFSSTTRIPNDKRKYIDNKIKVVDKIFGRNPDYPDYIQHSFPEGKTNPFEDVLQKSDFMATHKRLSVTSLLTKTWCELRNTYDLYSKIPRYKTSQLRKGTKQHSFLEFETHPEDLDWADFDKKMNVPQHPLLDQWIALLNRLVELIVSGEAREILSHTFIDSTSPDHISIKKTADEWETILYEEKNGTKMHDHIVLVSGIIDHLRWTNIEDKEKYIALKIQDKMKGLDLEEILTRMNQVAVTPTHKILVGDVKTRSTFKIPTQSSVVKSSKQQLMYYRYFMESLGEDAECTYYSLLLNAQRRGYDVDEPIDTLKAISLLVGSPWIVEDMQCLMDGRDIGFSRYDTFQNTTNEKFDLTKFRDVKIETIQNNLSRFFSLWQKPVTLRYFAARIAALYHSIGKHLGDRLTIEYYCGSKNFHNINFDYDYEILHSNFVDNTDFWFGRRDIQPIDKNVKNFLTYCRSCEYSDVCSWLKEGEEMLKRSGDKLT